MIYSYEELKGKIKVGDKVRAVEGKNNPCAELQNDGSNVCEITNVTEDDIYINGCSHGYRKDFFLELIEEPTERVVTWENLQKGDEILDGDGNTRTVLARIDDLVAISERNQTNYFDSWHTIDELKDLQYSFFPKPTKIKITRAELEARFEVVE